jgi:ribosomal protein L29
MAPKTRADLNTELATLRKQHFEEMTKSTFGGLTAEEDAVHQRRGQQIASLVRQLDELAE